MTDIWWVVLYMVIALLIAGFHFASNVRRSPYGIDGGPAMLWAIVMGLFWPILLVGLFFYVLFGVFDD